MIVSSQFDVSLVASCEAHAAEYMRNEYEPTIASLWRDATAAEWNFQTNLTDENAELSVKSYRTFRKLLPFMYSFWYYFSIW